MATTTRTDTPERSVALCRLLAWMSPAFPTGAFSYSHGLEAAVEAGFVKDLASLCDWTRTILQHGAGWSDAVFCARAWNAARANDTAELVAVAELAAAMRPSAEMALESTAQGAAFARAAAVGWPDASGAPLHAALAAHDIPISHPVAVGIACAGGAIPRDEALLAWLHAFAANLIGAAVRLVPLGQSDGLRALATLEPVTIAVAEAAAEAPLDEVGTAAAMVDWTSMTHETQYTRLFRS